jgi:hypothetical protein
MNADFTRDVDHAVDYLRLRWVAQSAPSANALGRAKRLLFSADRLREPADDALQEQLDQLHGLFMWGELMFTIARMDPAWIAIERRLHREQKAATAAWLEEAERRRKQLEAIEADSLKWGEEKPVVGGTVDLHANSQSLAPATRPGEAPIAAPDLQSSRPPPRRGRLRRGPPPGR